MEQGSGAGVQVLRSALVVVAQLGAAAPDKAEHVALVLDGEHHAVAEPVDQTSGAGAGGDPGGQHLLVAHPVPTQVVDQVRPAGWGLPGPEVRLAGEVVAESVGEVQLAPRPRQVGLEEPVREVVDLDQTLPGDRAVVPFLGALVGSPQLGLGRLQLDGAAGAAQSRQQQVALDGGRVEPVRFGVLHVDLVEGRSGSAGGSRSGLQVCSKSAESLWLDAVPQVLGGLLVGVVVLVFVGDGIEDDGGSPHQRQALVDSHDRPDRCRLTAGTRPSGDPRAASRAAERGRCC